MNLKNKKVMKNILTTLFCIVSFAAFSQSFNTTFPHPGFGDQVELEETGYRVMGFGNNITGNHLLVIHTNKYGDTLQVRKIYFDFDFFSPSFTLRSASDRDGNHYVNMSSNNDSVSLIKLSPNWQEVWRKNLTNNQSEITALLVTDDNHIIAAASKKLYKLDTNGNIIWQQNYGEANAFRTRGYSIHEVANGDLFLYASDEIHEGFNITYEQKLRIFDQDGIQKDSIPLPLFTFSSLPYEENFICLGTSLSSNYPNGHYLLYRHDINGFIYDEKEFYLTEGAILYWLVENHEGNLVAAGNGANGLVLHCMTKEGDSLWTRVISNDTDITPMDMKLAADGGYVISYFFESNDGSTYPGLIKTDAMGNISGLGFEESDINQRVKVYPNPAAEYVVFELQKPIHSATIDLTDICGRQIATIAVTGEKTVWQTAGLKPGLYLYHLKTQDGFGSGKLLIGSGKEQ